MVLILCNTAPRLHLIEPIGSRSTLDRVVAFAEELGASNVAVYSTEELPDLPDGWAATVSRTLTEQGLIELLANHTESAETPIAVGRLDVPFCNIELARQTIDRHQEFRAEYTFSDGYPKGLGIEVVAGKAVRHLSELARDCTLEPVPLFEIVQRDINRLDVETVLSEVDNRLLRLDLSVAERPDLVLCQRMAAAEPASLTDWEHYVTGNVPQHRTLPRFVSVQVLEQEVQNLSYSPYSGMVDDPLQGGRVMSTDDFGRLITDLSAFSPNAWVHLSLWGELALHPDPISLVRSVLETPGLRLLLETSGVGWSAESRAALFGIENARLEVIVGLDTIDPEVYRQIRGDGFDESHGFAREAVAALGERAHVQSVRSELTEPGLDAFYRHWKEITPNVVIQKYDHFSGVLPQRKVGDISPINRFPCWHLQRDLHVLVDGTVPLCREDIGAGTNLGNALSEGLEACWSRGADRYADHVAGKYDGVCAECDEYYVFTF